MTKVVLEVENLAKEYKLGVMNAKTFKESITNYFVHRKDSSKKGGDILSALDNVNFRLLEGETLGIIGHNGAGKSTLLKLLSQITPPSSGKIKIRGQIASLLEVGTGFHNELTGRENIYLNGAILGMKRQDIRVVINDIIEFSEISLKLIDTPIKKYSSGMKVRLAFAVAVHLKATILLLDEVLAVSDFKFQEKSLKKLKQLISDGKAIIYVSHDLEAIGKLCNKCILLEKGQLIKEGAPNEVIKHYLEKDMLSSDPGMDKVSLGFVHLSSLRIYSRSSKDQVISVGDGLEINFDFTLDKLQDSKKKKLSFKIQCKNEAGHLLFSSPKIESSIDKDLSGTLQLLTSSLNLVKGNYIITLLVTFGNENHKIDEFGRFSIHATNEKTLFQEGLIDVESSWDRKNIEVNSLPLVK